MKVIAMKVASVEDHPDAESLKIYWFEAPEHENRLVIANLENVYDVNDLVYVALEGAILKDGTKIRATKLRGIKSYGMAMGKIDKPDAVVGDDFTEQFCQEPDEKIDESNSHLSKSGISVIKWTDIESLFNIRRDLKAINFSPLITYRAKIKIDGSNGSVMLTPEGKIAAQSRTKIITPQDDNAGFAKWVNDNIDYFRALDFRSHDADNKQKETVTIFGEWAGSKIQKRTSISKIDRKIFAVFAIQYNQDNKETTLCDDPIAIRAKLPEHKDIFVLPWLSGPISLNYASTEQLENAIKVINKLVADIEVCDPWVKETFGVEGLGEGLVMYPQYEHIGGETFAVTTRDKYSKYVFKAKGEKHQVVKTKKAAQINPEVAASVGEFANLFATQARLEQGVTTVCNNEFNMKHLGGFLKWFVADVKKESAAELEASGLEWKQVNKVVMTAAREWYQAKVKEI